MSNDVNVAVTDEERKAAEEAEQAAFNGVFSDDSQTDDNHDDDHEEEERQQEEQDQAESEDQTAEGRPETLIAGMTKAQLEELLKNASRIPSLEKQLNDANGRYGGLKQAFDDLQKSKPGISGKLSAEKLRRMSDEFPEIAQALADDLSEIIGEPSGGLSQQDIDSKISSGIRDGIKRYEEAQAEKEFAKAQARLLKKHPDFFSVRETPEFKNWFSSLPHKEAIEFSESEDPDFVASRISEFKESLHKSTEDNKQRHQQQNQRRVERAVQPEVSKAPPRRTEAQTEQDYFDRVFKNRKR